MRKILDTGNLNKLLSTKVHKQSFETRKSDAQNSLIKLVSLLEEGGTPTTALPRLPDAHQRRREDTTGGAPASEASPETNPGALDLGLLAPWIVKTNVNPPGLWYFIMAT